MVYGRSTSKGLPVARISAPVCTPQKTVHTTRPGRAGFVEEQQRLQLIKKKAWNKSQETLEFQFGVGFSESHAVANN